MERVELAPGLEAFRCPESGGHWIPLRSYSLWLQAPGNRTARRSDDPPPELVGDANRPPLFCPESGALLVRYRVGRGLPFQIDRSPVTAGVWLDRGEWEALEKNGLHDELHRIFTAPYQREIRKEAYEESLRTAFSERIGEGDFPRVVEFREWMHGHPRAADIRAFLLETEL
jgi:Zn-finger nucleic acid-binding protein